MVMIDPERIQRLAAKVGNRKDALEIVHQMRCGGKKYPGGGKFFRTNLQQESPLMYQPMVDINYPIETPLRFRPQPDLGDYRAPESTGMIVNYPINPPSRTPVAVRRSVSAPMVVEDESIGDLFSDEAKARRLLRQRYAESVFDDKAVSNAGARGAWQIMPITYKDYLTRGRGKEGDLDDPDYNRLVRDHTFRMIPRDLEEIWDENYSDRNKLALLYAGYNRGANGLKKYLRGLVKKGVDISKPENWVEGMNPETRNYVHFLAYDEDVPGTYLMNEKFENAARERGYMAEGGRLYANGGPDDDGIYLGELQPSVKLAEEPLFVDTPYTRDDFFKRWYPNRQEQLAKNMAMLRDYSNGWPFGQMRKARKNVAGYTQSMLQNMDENLKEYSLIRSIWDRAYPHNSAYDPNRKWMFPDALKDEEARRVLADHISKRNNVPENNGIEVSENLKQLDDDSLRAEAWDNYGFSYSDDPYHIFYSSAWPSDGTIIHERTHTLRPLPGEYEKYARAYGNNPMEHAAYMVKRGQYDYNGWTGKTKDNLFTDAGRNESDISYYSNPHEIVARLNALRFNLGINPNRVITQDDLDEIRRRANKKDREEFLDLYTDEALLRFFNEVANAGEQESLYGNHLGNISANGGKIRIKPSHRGRLTELKERTGKTEAELYDDGNPAHKRMVVFARNSRKWEHGDGGSINQYDGETEETGWLRRFLNTPTRVPNMTGTATAAATGLRDIPLTDSTVGRELAVAGTAMLPLAPYLGHSAAVGIDTMGRMAMPSTLLKGVSYYAPKAAGALSAVSPWLDAGALSLWSAEAGKAAIDAGKRGDTGNAIGYGALAALPVVMPLVMKAYSAIKSVPNLPDIEKEGKIAYRVIDDAGLSDIINSGIIRPNQAGPYAHSGVQGGTWFSLDKPATHRHPTVLPNGNTVSYRGNYVIEIGEKSPQFPTGTTPGTVDLNYRLGAMEIDPRDPRIRIYDRRRGKYLKPEDYTVNAQSDKLLWETPPVVSTAAEATPAIVQKSVEQVVPKYEISDLGGGYMLKSLMRGNPLEKQISKNGTVNVNNVRALVGKGGKVEQAVVDKVLAEKFAGQKSVDYNQFRKAVQDELISWNKAKNTKYEDYGLDRLGYTVIKDPAGESIPPVYGDDIASVDTYTFQTPRIKTGSSAHYNPDTQAHMRTFTSADDPDVLYVLENQSDKAQGNISDVTRHVMHDAHKKNLKGLEKLLELHKNGEIEIDGLTEEDIYNAIEKAKLALKTDEIYIPKPEGAQDEYLMNNVSSRLIQENLKKAAESGQRRMRFATPETAAKIEGYSKEPQYTSAEDIAALDKMDAYKQAENILNDKYGNTEAPKVHTIYDGKILVDSRTGNTDVKFNSDYTGLYRVPLGEGENYQSIVNSYADPSIRAAVDKLDVPEMAKKYLEEYQSYEERLRHIDNAIADVSAKIQISSPKTPKDELTKDYGSNIKTILKKYADFPKQFKKLYKNADVRIVTDPKGNTWYEVDVPEDYLQQEWAYEEGGSMILPKMMMDKHSPDKLRKAIASIKAKRMK